MSVLENFKNIPRSPYGGRQGSNVIFFLQICNEVPEEKKEGGDRVPCVNTDANWNNCFRSFLFSKIHYSDAFFFQKKKSCQFSKLI